MKMLGALIIVIACALLGYEVYTKAQKKLKYIEGLIAGFEFFKSEISFSHTVLSDVLSKCSHFAGDAKAFFADLGGELNNEGVVLETIFEKYYKKIKSFVDDEVLEIVKDTVLQLGTNDVDSQVQLMESTIDKLNNCKLKQSAFCNKEGIMCKKVGIVTGVAIALMLF